jgi:hypothetical protein
MSSEENVRTPPDAHTGLGSLAAPNRARRRLIVGAVSVLPTAYTLSSGAATAVASNLRCLAAHENANPPRFVPGDDRWLREPVAMGQFEQRATYCVSTPQAGCMDGFNPGQAGTGSQWIVDGVDGNSVTAGPGAPIQVNGARSYGLVYVSDDGTVTSMDPGYGGDLYPTTKTCWASVHGSQDFKLG